MRATWRLCASSSGWRGDEVRVFPLLDTTYIRYAGLDRLRRALDADGVASEVSRVDYEFQRGGNQMMRICRRSQTRSGIPSTPASGPFTECRTWNGLFRCFRF